MAPNARRVARRWQMAIRYWQGSRYSPFLLWQRVSNQRRCSRNDTRYLLIRCPMEKLLYVPTINGQIYPIPGSAAKTAEDAITETRLIVRKRINAILGGISSAWTSVRKNLKELDHLRSVQIGAAGFILKCDEKGNTSFHPIPEN